MTTRSPATGPPTRRLAAADRRRTIEDAATELMAERGYAATTIEDVVRRAGVTKPILYRHFPSKQALAIALLERHRDELAAAPLDALIASEGRPFGERLQGMLEAWFAYVVGHPFVRLLLHEASGDDQVAALVEELHGRQRAADIALLREFAPHIPEHELPALGELVRSALAGLGLYALDHPEVRPAEPIVAMRRMVEGLVGERT
jgi:AcrR family transcriptional regulator